MSVCFIKQKTIALLRLYSIRKSKHIIYIIIKTKSIRLQQRKVSTFIQTILSFIQKALLTDVLNVCINNQNGLYSCLRQETETVITGYTQKNVSKILST